jgi:hypothetical protein
MAALLAAAAPVSKWQQFRAALRDTPYRDHDKNDRENP